MNKQHHSLIIATYALLVIAAPLIWAPGAHAQTACPTGFTCTPSQQTFSNGYYWGNTTYTTGASTYTANPTTYAPAQTANTTVQPAVQSSAACFQFPRDLSVGSRGTDVSLLQRFLISKGYSTTVTGYFGPLTSNALRSFQAANGISENGVFGPLTRAKVNAIVAADNGSQCSGSGTAQPTVTVSSPNGGEIYAVGNTVPIRWTSANVTGSAAATIKLYYERTGGGAGPHEDVIASNVSNSGSYQWTIPTTYQNCAPGALCGTWIGLNTFKVIVEIADPMNAGSAHAARDTSDGSFTIGLPTNQATTTTGPTIAYFNVLPTVVQGQATTWSGAATMGSAYIKRYRAFIVGSVDPGNGGWTNVTGAQSTVTFTNTSIPTDTNQYSFFRGPGTYTARFEAEDVNGKFAFAERQVTVTPAGTSASLPSATMVLSASTIAKGQSVTLTSVASSPSATLRAASIEASTDNIYWTSACPAWSSFGTDATNHTLTCAFTAPVAGTIYFRAYSSDRNGRSPYATQTLTVTAAPTDATNALGPTIAYLNVTPSVVQGQPATWSGAAVMGGAYLKRHRVYIVGSSNDTNQNNWTNASGAYTSTLTFSDSSLSTATNQASFFHGTGQYTVRYVVEDMNGKTAQAERTITITAPTTSGTTDPIFTTPVVTLPPTINLFQVSPPTVKRGETMHWQGYATPSSATAPIVRYRAYVVGSTRPAGDGWSTVAPGTIAAFDAPNVSTAVNPYSFFAGATSYIVRFEAEDSNGKVGRTDQTVYVNP